MVITVNGKRTSVFCYRHFNSFKFFVITCIYLILKITHQDLGSWWEWHLIFHLALPIFSIFKHQQKKIFRITK